MTDNNNTTSFEPQDRPSPAASRKPLRVGISHGDFNGVGYEVILKAFEEPTMFDLCTPIVFGSAKIAAYHRKQLGIELPFHFVSSTQDAVAGKLNLVSCSDEEFNITFGQISKEAGRLAFVALERAVAALRAGEIDVLVTAPICKNAIQSVDFPFPGHTEYLESSLGDGDEALMILCNEQMRVALATTHLPIAKVASTITTDLVARRIHQLHKSLRRDFLISAPRIAVLGLNPHSGDNGTLGSEEADIIVPAIKAAVDEGIQCFGPYPADGFFGARQYGKFDAVLAMYHDQGLAPFKTLSMDDGVNFTAGLPFVRTSPDHGTAFDIAGRNLASPMSMRHAIYTAIDVYRNRNTDDEATANPLPKLYREHREDAFRQRHNAPGQPEE